MHLVGWVVDRRDSALKGIGKGAGDGHRGVELVNASVTNGWDSKIPGYFFCMYDIRFARAGVRSITVGRCWCLRSFSPRSA
jgi:hypothetical protein